MLDKKLLKKIDSIFAKADFCLVEENVKLDDRPGNNLAEKTTKPPKQKAMGRVERPQGLPDDEVSPTSLVDKPSMSKTQKWFYHLLIKNGFRPQWIEWLKRTTKSND